MNSAEDFKNLSTPLMLSVGGPVLSLVIQVQWIAMLSIMDNFETSLPAIRTRLDARGFVWCRPGWGWLTIGLI